MRVEMLPAAFGDCLLVEYDVGETPHRILIDGGLTMTYERALKPRLARIADVVDLALLVVTHIDRDHIRGILPLLKEEPTVVAPLDIWFNGRKHLADNLGEKDGEALGELLSARALPWNKHEAFANRAVVVPDAGPLPRVELSGGATLTLLSPYRQNLTALDAEWGDELGHWANDAETPEAARVEADDLLGKPEPLTGLDVSGVHALSEAPFSEDRTRPNGSSIAFLLEHEGVRVLFAADAHPSILLRSIERLSPGAPLRLDAFKLSHHGSANNLSPAMLEKIDCPRFLISSDGSSYGHPNPETVARIIMSGAPKTLYFNYSSPYTTLWDDPPLMQHFHYRVEYPSHAYGGIVVILPP